MPRKEEKLTPIVRSLSPTTVLVGNPNVGKSVIFGYLTGRYATVSNYPGTTVEFTRGKAALEFSSREIIDTPGVNSLIPMSEDERVTLNILLSENIECVLQVADAKNLRRALLISAELSTLGVPMALILNMSDEAHDRGIRIDRQKLSELLDIPVIETVATTHKGLGSLARIIDKCNAPPPFKIEFGEKIENALQRIERLLPTRSTVNRTIATTMLVNPDMVPEKVASGIPEKSMREIRILREKIKASFPDSLHYTLHKMRLKVVDRLIDQVVTVKSFKKNSITQLLAKYSMHPILGIPILLVVLFIIYLLVGRFGAGTCVDFLQDSVFNRYLIPWTKAALDALQPSAFFKDFLVGEFGIFTMALTYAIAIVLPIVGFFFLAFGILEDSGYLPRLAVMSNKIFRLMGLNGRAVLPMVLGLGCATMATLTTRILDTKKERIIVTFLLALGVPCSAQLGVILGLLGGLSFAATAIWTGVVLFVLIFMGHLSSKVVKGKEADFILELPPIRMPQFSNILYKTRIRIAWYLREAVPLFVIGTVILFAADKTGALVWLEKLARPLVVHVLNLPSEVSAAFFVGFLRRDYGAVFLMDAAKAGNLDGIQIVVSLVTITLFVPCIANFFMMIKERGLKAAFVMVLIILPFSFGLGGIVNLVLRTFNVTL